MKIKKNIIPRYRLLKLQLIKAKVLKTTSSIKQVEVFFKKVVQIIYLYHLNNKKIFFIGVPFSMEKKFAELLKKRNHLYFSDSFKVNGLLSNRKFIYPYLIAKQLRQKKTLRRKDFKLLFSLKKKPDLIISLDSSFEKILLKEAHEWRVPVILINNSHFKRSNLSHSTLGNFKFLNKKIIKVFFFYLKLIFKRLKH